MKVCLNQKFLECSSPTPHQKSFFTERIKQVYRRKKFLYPDPDRDGLNYWRERIIFAVAATGSGLAFLALAPAGYQALTKQLWVLLIADILAFLLLSRLLFSRHLGLNAQALTVLSINF